MITNRKLLKLYIDADKFALEYNQTKRSYCLLLVMLYEKVLRYYEYHKNVGNKIRRMFYAWLLNRLGQRLGFSISGNCFGPGLRINHHGLLIVNAKARIGKWCDIHQGVNIGENGYIDENGLAISEVPQLGDFCFVGPGAKLFGKCVVGNNVRIGANAVVNKDVPNDYTAYGNPLQMHANKREIITIAKPNIEEQFLNQYPQYRELLASIK